MFLLYAEDVGLLQEKNAFYSYLKNFQVQHMRQALIDLFDTLRTPVDDRDPYLSPELSDFPYVNGGLFEHDIVIPHFDDDTRHILLQEASVEFDWSDISPTIFGAVFESTLNPETRRSGGMHYTSIENIHKVTGPLFYDALKDELTAIEGLRSKKERDFRLAAFRKKIASLKVLDPACGSGNFLTETYISLRKLENRVLENLYGGQMAFGLLDPIQVTTDQFFGIEINDFAVEVAKTALWIAELQMIDQTREILSMWIDPLPLKSNENVVCANALRIDWSDVLPAEECDYIIGNPPFLGARMMGREQKSELQEVASDVRNNHDIDYVAGWYVKAADMMDANPRIRAALVSTNSICQGAQPGNLWAYLIEERGLEIRFAHRTFIWDSEAADKAHVHCVIVGFEKAGVWAGDKLIFCGDETTSAKSINGYLLDAPNVLIQDRKVPLSDVPPMANGNQPRDGGHLLMTAEERDEVLRREPDLARFIRPFVGSIEFLRSVPRYCFWLNDASDEDISGSPTLSKRVRDVYDFRISSKAKTTNGYAKTPHLLAQRPQKQGVDFLLIPQVTGERRLYLPIGYMDKRYVASNLAYLVPDATLFHFGVLASLAHNAWMRAVAGRLEMRYRYSKEIVYNCFPWPEQDGRCRDEVEGCAQAVLDARSRHEGKTLAQMYDGISPMPENPSGADLKKYDQPEYADLLFCAQGA